MNVILWPGMYAEASWSIFHVTKSCCNPPIFIASFPNATCRSSQWCHITRIELRNYVVTITRFHWGRDIDCLPSPPYHWSCMPDQLLMWHNAACSVYHAQRQVSASLWNARAYGRSTYVKSVYKHYTVTDIKVTELTWRWLHGKRSPPQFVTNCSMRMPQAVAASLRDCPLTWRRNAQIQMYWLWKWLESYNNSTFSTWKDKFVFNLLFWIPNSFSTFHDYAREEFPSLPSLTARHWFFIIQIFEQLSFYEKQSCPETFHCDEIFVIFQDFWATCGLPWKTECGWIHCIEYIYI